MGLFSKNKDSKKDANKPVDLNEVLTVAQEGARIAGETMLKASNLASDATTNIENSNIAAKSVFQDLVTETDLKVEEYLVQHIQEHFPHHKIIAEESNGEDKYELTDDPTWTIDPIDGTTNFIHQLQLSCVLLSFLEHKQVKVCVIYNPYSDELFYATKGHGAFLETRPPDGDGMTITHIHASKTTAMTQSVVSMEPGYGRGNDRVARFTALQQSILQEGVRNLRMIGCTGLNLAYVACGRLDAAFEEGSWETGVGPKIWDFGGAKLLVEEAGGLTRDLELPDVTVDDNQELDLMKRSFFAAGSPELANELLKLIQSTKQPKPSE